MIPAATAAARRAACKPRASGDDPVGGRELTPADGNAVSADDLVNPA